IYVSSPAAPVPRGETELAIPAMCNRIRGLKEWSEIPRSLTRPLINFEYNPNVAPTEQVPAFLAERGKPLATRMARFGINLASSGGKRRPPLLNARTDWLRRGSFKTMLANKRCVIPAEGFYEWREEHGKKQPYLRQARHVRRHLGLFGHQRRSGSVLRDPDRRAE